MGSSILSVDLGNSAAKLRVWVTDAAGALRCTVQADFRADSADSAQVADFLSGLTDLELAAVSSVAQAQWAARWAECIERVSHARATVDLDPGLHNRTLAPHSVGRDRLFAARGALEWIGESAVVVDVGTALTVDALIADAAQPEAGQWRHGEFLGGAIAPGPALLARALAEGTARLFEVVPQADPPALGRDTAAAMGAGIGVGLRGAARELAQEIAREAGLDDPAIALTGGARAFVRSAFAQRRLFECADLVHLGICAALLEQSGRPRPRHFGPH